MGSNLSPVLPSLCDAGGCLKTCMDSPTDGFSSTFSATVTQDSIYYDNDERQLPVGGALVLCLGKV